MQLREYPVSDLMMTDVLTFGLDDNVRDAMRSLVEWDVNAGPVVDGENKVVGILSFGDLIVEEARLHMPTITNFFGVNVALPWNDRVLDDSVAKALGEFVRDVMTPGPSTIGQDETIEDAATLMHDAQVSRLPVVDGANRLIGLISRGDIVRAMVLGLDDGDTDEDPSDDDGFTEMLETRAEGADNPSPDPATDGE